MKKLCTPYLSTAFSEEGKKAKSRFENILSKSKKRAIFLVVSLLAAILAAEFLIACTGETTEKMVDDLENTNVVIGGSDKPTLMYVWDDPGYIVPVAAISTHAPLYYDKALIYQNRVYVTSPEMTTLANVYPADGLVDGRDDIYFVSLPAFHGGLYGYTKAENLNFSFGDEDYDYAQALCDMPEYGVAAGDTLKIESRNENIFTVTCLTNGKKFDMARTDIGIIEGEMRVYPPIYDYLEKEIKKYADGKYDNVMIGNIGFFPGRSLFDEESGIFDYTLYAHVTYTEKYTDEETVSYIEECIASGDHNRLTYLDEKGIFIHGMIPQIRIRFKLDKLMRIDTSCVELSYNAGQIVTNMPVQNPREEWIEIESIGEIFPEKLSKVSYSKREATIE